MIHQFWALILLLASNLAWCENAAEEVDPHLVPWDTIGIETLNVIVLFALLIYFLRRAVIDHFQGRLKAYVELVERAESAKAEAEKSHREISKRLHDLQASADENLRRAEKEAAELREKLLAEAASMAKKMEEDAHRSVELEIERAKSELRDELLKTAIETSRKTLEKSLGSSEQKRLQAEFVDKIQVVGQ